ncbi:MULTISPECIES: hypothetical protein [unclassified Gordonia (in: high G+C Gram-positive bacteria)]
MAQKKQPSARTMLVWQVIVAVGGLGLGALFLTMGIGGGFVQGPTCADRPMGPLDRCVLMPGTKYTHPELLVPPAFDPAHPGQDVPAADGRTPDEVIRSQRIVGVILIVVGSVSLLIGLSSAQLVARKIIAHRRSSDPSGEVPAPTGHDG